MKSEQHFTILFSLKHQIKAFSSSFNAQHYTIIFSLDQDIETSFRCCNAQQYKILHNIRHRIKRISLDFQSKQYKSFSMLACLSYLIYSCNSELVFLELYLFSFIVLSNWPLSCSTSLIISFFLVLSLSSSALRVLIS